MSIARSVAVSPILAADVPAVAAFLHENLDKRLTADQWAAAMVPAWPTHRRDHGFVLRNGPEVVGAYLAFYSERQVEGATRRICNLAAWCVQEEHRTASLRLLRAMLGQQGYSFTDLSPSGNVVPINERLGFEHLDTTTACVLNLPWPPRSRRARVISDPGRMACVLTGVDLEAFRAHAGSRAARHVVIVVGGEPCYVMFRRDRRKRLPLFASILYVGNTHVLRAGATALFRHLLLRHGIPLTLAELRIVGFRPTPSVMLRASRPKMFRSPDMGPAQIDYLYSELTEVAW